MTTQTKREYIALLWELYRKTAKRFEKSRILDEISRNLGIHRKSAVRLMGSDSKPQLRRARGKRASKISIEAKAAIARLWHKMGRMGSLAMHAALPEWLEFDDEFHRNLQLEVLKVSARSLERILRSERSKWKRKHNTGTKRARKPQTLVPLRPLGIKVCEVGHIEIDTVAHCGDSLSGTFAWTVTATDILSGWTDTVVVWGKDGNSVCQAMQVMEARFPFPWRAIYVDNGTEFLNERVAKSFSRTSLKRAPIPIYRCRPYRKNDQAFVEQKNWTHVRTLWGYVRVDYRSAVTLMNSVAENLWLPLLNGFVPQRKIISKVRIGARLKRSFDGAQTPFTRILARPESEVSLAQKELLIAWKASLNPFTLRKRLCKRVYTIFRLLDATSERPLKCCA